MGYRARSSADKANAIGDRAIASGKMASAMGSESLAAGTSSIAIGTKAQTGAENDIAIGTNQSVTGKNSGSIGYAGLETDANKTVITGEGTYSLGNTNSRVVGAESGIFGNSNSINAVTNVRVVGNTNKIGEITPASGAQAPDPNTATPVTYLKDIYVNGYNNKISSGSKLAKDLSGMFVLGHDNEVANITDPNAPGELAITDSTVIGARNKVNTEGASYFVLGNDVTATLANSVYLGSKSAYTVKGASTAGNTNYASEVLNGQARNFAGGTNLAGVVTVGAPGAERRIQNVGAGLINATSTDAINGSQLYQFTLPLRFAGDNSTIGSTAAADVNVIKRASDQAMSILGGATNLSDNNIGVVADAATNKMTVKLSKELKNLTSVQTVNGTKTTTMTGDGTTVKDGANVTTVTAAGTTVTNGTKTVTLAATGLDNGNNQIVNVASGLGVSTLESASGNTLTNATNVGDLKQAITNITAKGTGYGGDAGTAFITPLGQQTNVKGGITDTNKLTDGNIGVVSDAGSKTLNVKLAKDLQGLNSVTTTTPDGKTNVMNSSGNTVTNGTNVTTVTAAGTTVTDGTKTVTVTANGLNNGNNQIVNVASGLGGGSTLANASGTTLTNAANIGDLKTAITNLDTTLTNKGTGYGGDAGTAFVTPLGEQTNIKGGVTDPSKLSDGNIGVVADATTKTLNVKLAKDLQGLNSVTTTTADGKTNVMNGTGNTITDGTKVTTVTAGSTTVKDGNNVTTISSTGTTVTDGNKKVTVTANGLDNGGNKVVNVASGLDGGTLETASGSTLTNAANIEDLKTAVNSITDAGFGLKDEAGNVINQKLGTAIQVTGDSNIDTKVVDAVDANGTPTGGKALQVSLNNELEIGKAGADGKDGKIGVNGKDGSGVVINGKDGSIGLNGANGANGLTIKGADGKAGVDGAPGETKTRITYEYTKPDGTTGTEKVATLNDGMKYGGDLGTGGDASKQVIKKKLNEQVNVVGGITDMNKVADVANIAVIADGTDNLTLRLAKDLQGLNSVTTTTPDGKTNVMNGTGNTMTDGAKVNTVTAAGTTITDGTKKVTLTADGLNNGGNQITNVASGYASGETIHNVSDASKSNAATIGDLTKVVDKNVGGFGLIDKDGTEYKEDLGKSIKVTGDDNINTKFIDYTTTENGQQVTKKALQVSLADDITIGKPGADGKDGKITVTGKDGNAVVIDGKDGAVGATGANGASAVLNGKDGSLGLTGPNGENGISIKGDQGPAGVNGADGEMKTRMVYEYKDASGQPVKETVATLNDGMKYGGDTGTNLAMKLNEKVNIVGGITDTNKLTDGNIGVVSDAGSKTLNVKLAKDLQGLNSVTTTTPDGKTNVMNSSGNTVTNGTNVTTVTAAGTTVTDGTKTVTVTANGLNNGNNQIVNVASGLGGGSTLANASGTTLTNAANIGDLKTAITNLDTTLTNKGTGYGGDAGTAFVTPLGEQTNIKGGVTDPSKLSDGNIGVVADATTKTLNVKLAKDLQGLNSVTTTTADGKTNVMNGTGNTITDGTKVTTVTAGSTTVKDGNNVTTISSTGTTVTDGNKKVTVTANGLDNGGNKVVNVASGLDGGTLETASGSTLTNAANIEDLKTAVNSITDAGFGLKDEAGNVINQKLGTAIQVTGDSNIDTKVVDAVDANGTPTGGKALQVSLNNELEIGKAGADGKDGKIGVNGKDGSGVVINGKDGSIGLNGANGANGLTIKGADGKAGVDGAPGETKTRITYEYTKPDGTTGTEKVATLNDGMKYGGDLGTGGDASKQVIKKKLNEQVNVVGGITDMNKVADVANIAVIADGTDNLTLRLAKDLQGLNSVTTTTPDGKTNVMNGTGNTMTDGAKVNTVTAAGTTITDGTKKVTLTADGLNNGGNQITNVASGYASGETIHNVSDASKSNAATIGDLTKVVDKNVGGFGLIDKDGTEYKEDLGKSIKVTGDDNINTKFIDYTTTENGQQVTKKALQVSLADDITIGKPGADGKDGKITVTGKDGNAVVIDGKDGAVGATGANGASAVLNGKDGSLGLTGPNGENGISIKGDQGPAGVNGADGEMKTRMVYEYKDASGQPVKETVATLNDGMKYGGDTGTNLAMKLNEKVNIVGGITDESKLAQDPNIGVVADGTDTLKIKLAKNLKGLESVQTGDTTMNSDGLTIINGPSITKTGIDAGDMNITNVAPGLIGPNSKDAINGSQLWDTNQKVSKLGNQINRVGAGAAALSALHPLDFDPDDKWDITAGYGNYKGAHALALGTFYRPNESTMFSLGASIGGGENMFNAGISVKLGQGNNVTTSRVAMAKEIIDLRDDNKELRKQVEEINNRLNSLLGILDMSKKKDFPDVPDNHWAYNYVATLAGNGLVEGYPDGTFAGDRTMTRYEFAAIIYRALKNGAPVDENMDRAMNEFEPELRQIRLDRIRVDRISGNDTDKYKVERVRVNNKDNEEKNDYRDIYGGSIPKPIVETGIAE